MPSDIDLADEPLLLSFSTRTLILHQSAILSFAGGGNITPSGLRTSTAISRIEINRGSISRPDS
jgi:hypothetical protein